MDNLKHSKRELSRLLLQDLNEGVSRDDFERIGRYLKSDPALVEFYVEFMILYSGFVPAGESAESSLFEANESDNGLLDPSVWARLSQEEKVAPPVEIQISEDTVREPLRVRKVESSERIYSKTNLWFSMISIAAVFVLILYVWNHPRHIPQDVATITDIYNARWADSSVLIEKGIRLFNDREFLSLREGVLKIQFDNGAKVVIEGPAEFSIETGDRISLNYGRVYARVPRPAIGFRVNTPSCGVIDLGTEFGVDVNGRGETNVQLFKGKASLVIASENNTQQIQPLQPHEAKWVTASGNVQTVTFHEHRFVRDFDSQRAVMWNGQDLSLADIASGGDGWNAQPMRRGIDQKTGRLTSEIVEKRDAGPVYGYIAVPEIPYVDGVFVPDCDQGPVQITSAGHVFDGFGDTGGGYFIPIGSFSSAMMYQHQDPEDPEVESTGYENRELSLKGYSGAQAVNLCLHSNSGLTYDLQKIREAVPFAAITQFSSVYGVPVTVESLGESHVDFYVFVDGVPRMVKKSVSNYRQPGQVTIPLSKNDRFLTLVCTEGAANWGDWSLFVNPVLKLKLVN